LISTKGFTNHEQTDITGLIYMGGRFYLPQYHRFVSPDPAMAQQPENPQSWNLYSYCQNDPVTLIDPTGLEGVPWYLGGSSPMVDRGLNGLYSLATTYNLGFQMVGQPADALTAGINALGNANLPMLSNMGKSAEAGAGSCSCCSTMPWKYRWGSWPGRLGETCLVGSGVSFRGEE